MSHNMIKPWQRLPDVSCELCPAQATNRVTASSLTMRAPDVAVIEDRPFSGAALVCDDHEDAMARIMFAQHGGASGGPLRASWRIWFMYDSWIGRPIGRLETVVHNWRCTRGSFGKHFGYRFQDVSMDDDADRD